MPIKAYAAASATTPLAPIEIDRREPTASDVEIRISHCGVCHSDLHTARGEWAGTKYPCVPGHEIVGRVVKTGAAVTKFKEGDIAAVGCMVDACRKCGPCKRGLEQYCELLTTLSRPLAGPPVFHISLDCPHACSRDLPLAILFPTTG